MQPIKLEIENFACYGKSEINFNDFSSAIIIGMINGNERHSNASGKSTIFAAIRYVLFNRIDASSLDRSIRRGCDMSRVAFEFISSIDDLHYRIERSRDKKSADIRLFRQNTNTWDDISQRTASQTEVELLKVLGMNYELFNNSILFSQSDLYGIASLTAGKRKQALKDALQLGFYGKMEKVAKKRLDDIRKEVDRTKIIISTIGNPEEILATLDKELQETSSKVSDKQLQLDALKTTMNACLDKQSHLTNEFNTLNKHNSEIDFKKKSITDDIRKLQSTINEYEMKLSSTIKSGKLTSDNINKLSSEMKSLSSKEFRPIEQVKLDLANTTATIIDNQVAFQTKKIEFHKLSVPLPEGAECDKCRSVLTSEHIDKCKAEIDIKFKEINSSFAAIEKTIASLRLTEKAIGKEISDYETSQALIQSKTNLITQEKRVLESKKALHKEYISILDNNNLQLKDKEASLQSMLEIPTVDISKLQTSMQVIKSTISSSERDIEAASSFLASLSNTKSVILHKIDEKSKDLSKLKSLKNDFISLQSKFVIHEKVAEAFGPAGIPALITHTVLDDFQIETNHLLSQLFPGLQLKFSIIKDRSDGDKEDTLEISYSLNGNDDLEYAELSGAQKLIVSLCLKLGLSAVVNKRLGIEIKLLLIDEVDQSLDEDRLEVFEDAIKKLQDTYKILIITHNKELKDKFNHAILVEQDENAVSTARVVSQW